MALEVVPKDRIEGTDSGRYLISEAQIVSMSPELYREFNNALMNFAAEHPDYSIAIESPYYLSEDIQGVMISWRRHAR